jgi:hypothetical protein
MCDLRRKPRGIHVAQFSAGFCELLGGGLCPDLRVERRSALMKIVANCRFHACKHMRLASVRRGICLESECQSKFFNSGHR